MPRELIFSPMSSIERYSSGSNKKRYVPRPRTQPLRRGKACLNCRYLKIKCDGVKPMCGACSRIPKDDECEYTDGPSRTQELQDAVMMLQGRLREFEGYSDPLASGNAAPFSFQDTSQQDIAAASDASLATLTPSGTPERASFPPEGYPSVLGIQEPPVAIIETLLDAFLPHSFQFGFFLNVDEFRNAALQQLPFGDPGRPSPGLLHTVYLWGTHLSSSSETRNFEALFCRRALIHIAQEISLVMTNPSIYLYTIQATALLSTYFLRNNRLLEAEYHLNGAITLVLAFNLHKTRSSRFSMNIGQQPQDSWEDSNKIIAFWTIFALHRNLMICLGKSPNSFGTLDDPNKEIDTPWPMDLDLNYGNSIPQIYFSAATIQHYFANPGANGETGPSLFAEYVKATILHHHACHLEGKWRPDMSVDEFNTFRDACFALDRVIATLLSNLPSIHSVPHDGNYSSAVRTITITHTLTTSAVMKLHRIFSGSRPQSSQKCILAAQSILQSFGNVNLLDFQCLVPVSAVLCASACQTLIEEVLRSRAAGQQWPEGSEDPLVLSITSGIATMAILANNHPFMRYQLVKTQEIFSTIN